MEAAAISQHGHAQTPTQILQVRDGVAGAVLRERRKVHSHEKRNEAWYAVIY